MNIRYPLNTALLICRNTFRLDRSCSTRSRAEARRYVLHYFQHTQLSISWTYIGNIYDSPRVSAGWRILLTTIPQVLAAEYRTRHGRSYYKLRAKDVFL